VAITEADKHIFVSGSVDGTAKVWDIRTESPVVTFVGHESDVNAVDIMRSGMAVATGSDDFTLRMFDMRALAEVACFSDGDDGIVLSENKRVRIGGGVTSTCFSLTGRYLFAGYEDNKAIGWDTIAKDPHVHLLQHAEDEEATRISDVGVSADGTAVCTASWDMTLAVWA
jgi:WD40 repeat protein